MSRTIAVGLLSAAAGILWTGCGASHSTAPTRTTGARPAIGKAQAQAYAHEVNLTAADVPGATMLSQEHETGEAQAAAVEFAGCSGGVSPRRRVANVASAKFRIGTKTQAIRVKSSVEVMPSAGLSAQNYSALASARGRACIAQLLPQALGGTSTSGARVGPATISLLPNLLSAGRDSFGLRVSSTLTAVVRGRRVSLPVYLDLFALLAGPAEVSMSVSGIIHPPPKAAERRLLSLIYTRAEMHKL